MAGLSTIKDFSTLQSCFIGNNHANYNGFAYGYGGAIFNESQAHLIIDQCTFQLNLADVHGGAIYNQGDVEIKKSTFSKNTAGFNSPSSSGLGGAIYQDAGSLIIYRSTLDNNSASSGGGLYAQAGDFQVYNSTLAFNLAASAGGSAIYLNMGSVSLSSSTVAFNRGPQGFITEALLVSPGTSLTLINTIVASSEFSSDSGVGTPIPTSTPGSSSPNCGNNGVGIVDNGNNLDSDGSCQFSQASSLKGVNPQFVSGSCLTFAQTVR